MSDMNEQQFQAMMQMHRDTHDKIDSVHKQLDHANGKLEKHIEEDLRIHAIVNRHTIYWRGLSGLFSTGLAAGLTWLGMSRH